MLWNWAYNAHNTCKMKKRYIGGLYTYAIIPTLFSYVPSAISNRSQNVHIAFTELEQVILPHNF